MPEETKIFYGRRKDDMDELTPDVIANLTDSQKVHVKIAQNLVSVNTILDNLNHDVGIHNKILITGNGTPSIQERLRVIESFVENWRYWVKVIGGALIIQTLTFFFATLVALIRFLPLLEKLANQP